MLGMIQKGLFVSRRALVGVAIASALSACAPEGATVPQTAQFSPTKDEQAEMIAIGHASAIAKGCGSIIRLDEMTAQMKLHPIEERAKASGVRVPYEIATLIGISKKQAEEIGAEYRASRGIDPGDSATWCAAGRYEIANKTRIGQYLSDPSSFGSN